MPTIALSLLSGGFFLHSLPGLPAWPLCAAILLFSLVLRAVPVFHVLAGFLAGFAGSGLAAGLQLADRLDPAHEAKPIDISAVIRSFPVINGEVVSFVVSPESSSSLPSRIRLSWHAPAVVPRMGDTWRLQVRLRRPSGYANPGGFDLEGWLFRERIGATGYVVEDGRNYPVHGSPVGPVDRMRRHIVDRIDRRFPAGEPAAVMMAIVVGARHAISRDQWDTYASTGTSHLMAISGLHIGLAAGAVYVLFRGVLALLPGVRNLRDRAMLAAMLMAALYASMSGFAVPARRACIMLALVVVLTWFRREISPFRLLAMTIIIVALTDPLSILTPGFKLSFSAVAILFCVGQTFVRPPGTNALARRSTTVSRLWSVQLALLAGLLPLTVSLFDRFAVLAPAVNLAVLPVFNAVTVPFSIAGVIADGPVSLPGDRLLGWAYKSIQFVLHIISVARDVDAGSGVAAVPVALWILLLPILYVLLPSGWPSRRLSLLAAVAAVHGATDPVPDSCFDYHVLDVGQGQAVVVETREHALLFDTGPAFRSATDTAELVVAPFLAYRGLRRLDTVVISHADLDHAGGIATVLRRTRVGRVLSGERLRYLGRAQETCTDNRQWRWDGVDFRVLHPRVDTPWRGNNASCVVEISAAGQRLLLTGDIEAPVEVLLDYRQQLRPVHALTVPHHGSRTSSHDALVNATRPSVAIVSAGRMNRWGFPKPDVVQRWQSAGAVLYDTGTSGAVSQRLCADGPPGVVREARRQRVRYWNTP